MHEIDDSWLTCYLHEGWQPQIEPASARRAWMDASPERFAYRCLPLTIANSHGWIVRTPMGFWARWTGGGGREDVEIRPDPGPLAVEGPVSIFGQGVLSFHVPGIFRTPPGTNIFLTGPTNDPIDGISPLSGIIETDWSPYSFTMNWKFTRAGQWVRFNAGQPFAFFFPVPRGYVESFQPEYRALDSKTDLASDFAAWDDSRRAFQVEVERNPPAEPAAKWQKLYYRGLRPHGERSIVDHQAKLHVAPFSGAITPGALLQSDSASPTVPRPSPDLETLLQRRDWLLRVQERQRRIASDGGGLIRVEPPTSDEFRDEIYATGRPVVIEGLARTWRATRWTRESLTSDYGDIDVEVQVQRNTNPFYERQKDRHRRVVSFSDFLEEATDRPNDWYLTAYNAERNQAFWNRLAPDLGRLDAYLTHEGEFGNGMPWIGGLGSFTPLHHDLTNNLLVQLVGVKSILLVPPSEAAKLYPAEGVFSEISDLDDPEQISRFPLARSVEGYRVDLSPGDALFIPVGWWHQVRSQSFSVSATYTCFRWPNDAFESWPG
jgi:hypothetical protein